MPRVGSSRSGGGILPFRRWAAHALFGLLILFLAGCTGGNANDAQRAQQRDASQPAVLAAEQATRNAQRFEATPGITPTATPDITVYRLGLAENIQGDNAPTQMIATVPNNAGTVYIVIEVDGIPEGSVVTSTWLLNAQRPQDRSVIAYTELTVTDGGRQWLAFPITLDGSVSPGNYAAVVEYGTQSLGSLGIEITPSGTAPRRVQT